MNTENAVLLHDLKMPLQLMISSAQLLEMEIGRDSPARGYVEVLLAGAREMQKMLAVNAEPADDKDLHWVRADLVSQTWEFYTRCHLYARRKGIRMSFHANTDCLNLALDEGRYSRIMLNLISNALKFTPEGGSVQLNVRALGDFAEVDVIDDGCGIAADRLHSIFDLHETSDGYGYGLYIAREYAKQLGGTLNVLSSPGKGSTFTLRLPVKSAPAAFPAASNL